jgi:hypothetical protein
MAAGWTWASGRAISGSVPLCVGSYGLVACRLRGNGGASPVLVEAARGRPGTGRCGRLSWMAGSSLPVRKQALRVGMTIGRGTNPEADR